MSKEINIVWVGKYRLPYKYYQNLLNWRKLNPEYTINLITDDNSLNLAVKNVNVIPWQSCIDKSDKRQVFLASVIADALQKGRYGTVSNIVRFIQLYNKGGYYFDTDNIPQAPLNKMGSDISFASTVRANPRQETASIYGNFIFSVSTLYSAAKSPILDRVLTTMYETFAEQSMDKALDIHKQDFNFVQSYYTASLMLSRTINAMAHNLQSTDNLQGYANIANIQKDVVKIESDESWGEGMKAVQMQSRHLAAQSIVRAWRFFKEQKTVSSDVSTTLQSVTKV